MNNYKSYSDKLKDPRWQRKRLEMMQRDNFTCQLCDDVHDTLNVHHKIYIKGRDPWDYPDENFITYCEVCHKVIEECKKADILAIKSFKQKSKNSNQCRVLVSVVYNLTPIVILSEYDYVKKSLEDSAFLKYGTVRKAIEFLELANNYIKGKPL